MFLAAYLSLSTDHRYVNIPWERVPLKPCTSKSFCMANPLIVFSSGGQKLEKTSTVFICSYTEFLFKADFFFLQVFWKTIWPVGADATAHVPSLQKLTCWIFRWVLFGNIVFRTTCEYEKSGNLSLSQSSSVSVVKLSYIFIYFFS